MTWQWIGLLTILVTSPSFAHRTHGPARSHLFSELQSIGRQLGYARDQLSDHMDISTQGAAKALNQAEVDLLGGDPARATMRLLKLLSRPGVEKTPAYPEALSWLGRALIQLDFEETGAEYLAKSLDSPRQTPSAYRRRLRFYLRHGAVHTNLETTQRAWRRTLADPPIHRDRFESELHYLYARALHLHGEVGAATNAFERIGERDAFYLHAQYFLGVLALGKEDILTAKSRFAAARKTWQRRMERLEGIPTPLDEIGSDGPRRSMKQLKGTHRETDEAEKRLRRLGAVIHLALARLAAHEGKDKLAWKFYRQVPPGDPDADAALRESAFILARQGELRWSVRLVEQLIGGRTVDADAMELRLWQGQMLARNANYGPSRHQYRQIVDTLQRARKTLDRASQSDTLFPRPVLDWTVPKAHQRASRIENDVRVQTAALTAAQSAADTLKALLETPDALPTVAHGRRVAAQVTRRAAHFEGHLREVEKMRHQATLNARPEQVDLPTSAEVARMNQSLDRLRQRLSHYEGQLAAFERHYRQQIQGLVAREVPRLRALHSALAAEQAATRALANELRAGATAHMTGLEARALFGQVDIAFWKKQEATRQLREAAEARAKGLKETRIPPDGATQVRPLGRQTKPTPAKEKPASKPASPSPAPRGVEQVAQEP